MINQAVLVVCIAVTVYYFLSIRPFYRTEVEATASLNTSYDYVIIGAGSAGSVLASRLSERGDNSVLLLEAGGHYNENPISGIPALFPMMLHTNMDWSFYTAPQQFSSFGMNDKRAIWPRGRTLGGSSVINFLQFVRGNKFDFDEWESLGCSDWSYKDVLPYFKKLEDVQIADVSNSEYRGRGGPIGVIDGRGTALADRFMDAFREMGVPRSADVNGEDQYGYSPVQLAVRDGVRSSAGKEYLNFPKKRNNLHIGLRTTVIKIEIADKEATGVYILRNGKKMFIEARKEVILSAGAIKSPQLLMLSGIGPKQHLSEMSIPVIADLPVGENLQDHPLMLMFSTINESLSVTQSELEGFWSKLNYGLTGGGPLGRTGVEVNAFLYSDPDKIGKTYTDFQFNFVSTACLPNLFNYKDSVYSTLCDSTKDYGFFLAMLLNHPQSKGSIKLRSSDPFEDPWINQNYFSIESDIAEVIKGIRLWEKFMETKAISSLGATTENQRLPICAMHDFRSDAYWECYVRHLAVTGYHPCCTNKMGSREDGSAVVDPQLRVKFIHRLRVVDASIFPQETCGNLNAPTIMVAEKAADVILNEQ